MAVLERMVDKMINTPQKEENEPNGVFMADMSEEEYKEYTHLEVKGWKKFYNKIYDTN